MRKSEGITRRRRAGGIVHLFSWTDVVGGELNSSYSGGFQSSDDYIFMPLQGSTQWDALCHYGFQEMLFNGFWVTSRATPVRAGSR